MRSPLVARNDMKRPCGLFGRSKDVFLLLWIIDGGAVFFGGVVVVNTSDDPNS